MKRFLVRPGSSAFSLIEVAIAMAILAVAMTGVLALLPVGLDSARQVHNETVATMVARTAIGNLWLSNLGRTTFLDVSQVQFLDQNGQTNANPNFHYFRLQISQDANNLSANSCRYLLTLEWPKNATNTAPLLQRRVFVTEVVRQP